MSPARSPDLPNLAGDLLARRRRRSSLRRPRSAGGADRARRRSRPHATRMSEWVVLHALLHLRQFTPLRTPAARTHLGGGRRPARGGECASASSASASSAATRRESSRRSASTSRAGARTPKSAPGVDAFTGADGLDALLARTDILVALLPLTPQTRGILDARSVRKIGARRPSRRSGPHQRRARRLASRGRHPRRARLRRL